jgi:hypothetical protein
MCYACQPSGQATNRKDEAVKPSVLFLLLIAIALSFVFEPSVKAQQGAKRRAPNQKLTKPPTKQKDGIEYSVLSIEWKGQSMRYGNANISAPEGKEVVELKLRVKPVSSNPCCKIADFELETVEGQKAESVWESFNSAEETTFALQFIAPEAARFKVFKVNGVAIDVGTIPLGKPKP